MTAATGASAPTCQHTTALAPDHFCGKPATVSVSAMCVHEHVRNGALCLVHAADGRKLGCASCFAHDGHICVLTRVDAEWVTAPSDGSHAHG